MTITTTNVPKSVELKIIAAIELKKELEKYEREIKEELFDAMKAHNILSIKNDSYTVSLAKRTTYSAEDITAVDPKLTKTVLDTTKVSQMAKLYGNTPDGVQAKETEYLTWRAK